MASKDHPFRCRGLQHSIFRSESTSTEALIIEQNSSVNPFHAYSMIDHPPIVIAISIDWVYLDGPGVIRECPVIIAALSVFTRL